MDVEKIRADFPILQKRVHGKPLVYLDNAASTQKPRQVIEALSRFYFESYSNIHRGIHELSQEATAAHDDAREKVRRFLGASDRHEIVFVRGATEAINLVVWSWGWQNVGAGDEVLITALEHHANIVPWQMLCARKGASLCVAPIDDRGVLLLDKMEKMINGRTRIIAATHVSNVLGTVNPVHEMIEMGHRHGVPVLIDGAQAVPHTAVDVAALGCDFYVFSGHKIYGPSGIGALYGRRELLDEMPPWQCGGDMIDRVTYDKTTFNVVPYKFEAGTPDIAGAIGLGAAIDYMGKIGIENIAAYEQDLLDYATARLGEIPGLRIVGTAPHKASVVSFVVDGTHPTDIATILDQEGVAIRTGHHCAMPLMERLGLPGTARASFSFYNTREEIDVLAGAVKKAIEMLR
ncbi:cysteine desulfurase [bacterium]|nr:cysteine desulfurase [bacterium]